MREDGNPITMERINQFLEDNEGCWIETDWHFQWADSTVEKPDDNVYDAGEGWTSFEAGKKTTIPMDAVSKSGKIWFREMIYQTHLFVPFSDDLRDPYGAEFYCYDDVYNYDNYDYITPEDGGNYHCVGLNAYYDINTKVIGGNADLNVSAEYIYTGEGAMEDYRKSDCRY